MNKKIIIVLLILILVFLFKFAISHRYQWDSKSPEYALHKIYIAKITKDKYLGEAYTSETFYKNLAIQVGAPITPNMFNALKTAWLDTFYGNQIDELDDKVRKMINNSFSHIIYLQQNKKKSVNPGKSRLFVVRKPKVANDVIDYSIFIFADKCYEEEYKLTREAYGWKLIEYDTKTH